jgi:hypothetical protein
LDACFRACSAAVKPNVSYCWDVSKALPPISCNWCPNCQQINSNFLGKKVSQEITNISQIKKMDTLGVSCSVKYVNTDTRPRSSDTCMRVNLYTFLTF